MKKIKLHRRKNMNADWWLIINGLCDNCRKMSAVLIGVPDTDWQRCLDCFGIWMEEAKARGEEEVDIIYEKGLVATKALNPIELLEIEQ